MFGFIQQLDRAREKLASLAVRQDPRQVMALYEIFLSGCYEKIEECDDSGGGLGMFFHDLFCGWVQARQAAGCPANAAVKQVLPGWRLDPFRSILPIHFSNGPGLNSVSVGEGKKNKSEDSHE